MPFEAKPLADGQLATSPTAIYTVPGGALCAYVKRIALYNTNAAEQTVLVSVNMTGTSRRWRRYVLAQNESVDLLDHGDVLHLGPADTLIASTTTAAAVDFFVTGIEETAA